MRTFLFSFSLGICFLGLVSLASADPIQDAEDKRNPNAAALHQGLQSANPKIRARTAVAYGRIQTPLGLEPLRKLAHDSKAYVREAAAFAIGQLGFRRELTKEQRQQAATTLHSMTQDKHQEVRLAAIEALGKVAAPNTLSLLLPTLKGTSTPLQAEAVLALYRYQRRLQRRSKKRKAPPLPTAVLQTVLSLADSTDVQVRRNLAYLFARIPEEKGLHILLQLAQDPSLWVRYFALHGLRKLKHEKALQVALSSTKHPSYIIRTAAVQTLQAIQYAHLIPSKLDKDPSFRVRRAVALAYGSTDKIALKRLQALQQDASKNVQAAALHSLAKRLPSKALPLLQKALKHSHWLLREAALQASKPLKAKRAPLLFAALKDKDVRVRALAVEALGSIPTRQAFQAIQNALTSKHLIERGSAVYALTKRKDNNVAQAAWTCYRQSQHRRWIELREELVDIVAGSPGKTTTQQLQEALKDPAPSVAAKARNHLAKRGVKNLPQVGKPALTFSPHRQLRFSKNPIVIIQTNRGSMAVECFANKAPIHVANFVGLVQRGFYNGLLWHRVVSNFVIQGGDPDGTGWGDGGFSVRAEINRARFTRGTLGMPRAQGWDTGSVQLFFTHTPTPHLDGLYTVFGRIIRGFATLDSIQRGDLIVRAYLRKPTPPTSQPSSQPTSRPSSQRTSRPTSQP